MLKLTEDKKSLLSNFFSLSTLQGVNMILPLITLPYLVRVLGVDNFGLVNFSLSIIMYFHILVSFGFELSATREISIHRDDKKKIAEIFSAVMIIKTAMAIISLFILSILIVAIDSLQEHAMLYYATFGIVIGNVLFPSWFFQGMERMKYITYINVVSRVTFTILIFLLVQESSDFIYVPILNSLGVIIGGFYSLWLIFKLFDLQLTLPNRGTLLLQLKDSYHFFLSRVANNGSRYYVTTVVGIYFGNIAVGYYSIVEKFFYAFMGLGGIISQTIYPYMSRTKNIRFFKKILFLITSISIATLIPTMYFNELLIQFVFNIQDEMLSKIFLIVFSGSIFGIVSALVGYPLLAAFGHIKYANNSLIYASIVHVLYITSIVIYNKDIYLLSLSLPIYMIVGLIFRIYYVNKTKLL
jgi:polysaccharide transporter, PST family